MILSSDGRAIGNELPFLWLSRPTRLLECPIEQQRPHLDGRNGCDVVVQLSMRDVLVQDGMMFEG